MTASMTARVFFHSPYMAWSYHGAMEATLAHALEQRGAQTTFTLCDSLFPECDVFRRGFQGSKRDHRPSSACHFCQAQQATELATFHKPWTWLGRHIPREIEPRARAFVDALATEDLLGATWSDQPVGLWAQSSAFNQFRLSRIDLDDAEVVKVLRDCIYGAILSWEGLTRAFDEFQPDVVVVFNGRFFGQRVAVELAKQRGLRLICHERGFRKSTALWRQGGMIHDLDLFDRIWNDWHQVPLTLRQVRDTSMVFHNRRFGKDLNWKPFSPPPEEESQLRAKLQLDDRPIVACFTSSDDEWLTFPERRAGPFPDSLSWVPATVEAARQSPELQWVIRLHPNLKDFGTNQQAVDQAERVAQDLPENCRMVFPEDKVSSYTIADMAACGVVYGTTMGVEMASRGKPVVAVARGWYGNTDMVTLVGSRDDYLSTVRAAAARGPSIQVALMAHRFMHHLYEEVSIPFPWVQEQPHAKGRFTFKGPEELAPGRSAVMDRLCDLVLHGRPLQDPPASEQKGARDLVEERFLLRTYPWLAKAADRQPNPLSDALDRGRRRLEAGNPAAASQDLMRAAELAPGCAEAWMLLGRALGGLGQVDGAVQALQRSVGLDKADGDAWVELVRWLKRKGDLQKLKRAVRQARASGIKHPEIEQVARRLGVQGGAQA